MTSENKYTPGPWKVIVGAGGHYYVAAKDGAICNPCWGRQDTLDEANARLIAAAPAMYDFILKQSDAGNLEATAILEGIKCHT